MDTIAFKVRPSGHWFGDEIEIEINGGSLVESCGPSRCVLLKRKAHRTSRGAALGYQIVILVAIKAFLW
jgi:hypothetical protein